MNKIGKSLVQLLLTLCLVQLLAINGKHASVRAQDTANAVITQYEQQRIAVLDNVKQWPPEDKPDFLKEATFLYRKHPAVSEVVVWHSTKEEFFKYDINEEEVTTQKVEKINANGLQIQILGCGEFDTSGKTFTMSGFSATEIANAITKLVEVPTDPKQFASIFRVSLSGWNLAPDREKTLENDVRETFFRDLCTRFHQNRVRTIMNAQSELIAVCPTGQKMIGKQVYAPWSSNKGVKWVSKEGYEHNYKYMAYIHPDSGEFHISEKAILAKATKDPYVRNDQDMDSGVLSEQFYLHGSLLHMIDSNSRVEKTRRLKGREVTYNLLNEVAKSLYNDMDDTDLVATEEVIIRDHNMRAPSRSSYWTREVRKITKMIEDFMAELKRRAVAYKRGEWKSSHTKPSDYLYYRYGDWIYKMQKDTFRVNLEGVVGSEFVPSGFREQNEEHNKADLVQELSKHGKSLQHENVNMEIIPEPYPQMKPGLSDQFMKRARHWIYGHNDDPSLSMPSSSADQIAQSYDGQMTLAMFLSESIRNFRTHVTNIMGLDLAKNKFLSLNEFFVKHPMARVGTWRERVPMSGGQYRKKVGMEPEGLRLDESQKELPDPPKDRLVENIGTWMARMKASCDSSGSFKQPGTHEMLGSFQKKGWTNTPVTDIETGDAFYKTLRDNIEERILEEDRAGYYTRWHSKLESDIPMEMKEADATVNGVEYDEDFDDEILPITFSSLLAIDLDFINNKVDAKLQEVKDQYPGKEVEIDLHTVQVKGNEVTFEVVYDKSAYPPRQGRQPLEGRVLKRVQIDDEQLLTKHKLLDFHKRTEVLDSRGFLQNFDKGYSIYGTVLGLDGSMHALQEEDIPHGMVKLSPSLHGIGELLSKVNRKVNSVSMKLLGNMLKGKVSSISKFVSKTVLSQDILTRYRALIQAVPVVGPAFGVYNIIQDFQQMTTRGYDDIDLNHAITGLGYNGPDADIITVPISMLRMGIDTALYPNIPIKKSLPLDAQIREFFEKFGQNILNSFETFRPIMNTINTVSEFKKLDAEYNKEQDFLKKLENYHNYYDIVSKGAKIDYTDGVVDPKFGGSIVFTLEEDGNAQFSYVADIVDGVPQRKIKKIKMDPSVKDFVLGMGKTLKITTKEANVRLFGLITVDSQRIINDPIPDKKSLHGTYHGNTQDNNFYCVQDQPPDLPQKLTEYHYEVYGHAGDDKFMLGPQHTYVEGGSGSDTIYIHERGCLATINNYATDAATDYVALYAKYDELEFLRDNLDFVIRIKSESGFALGSSHSFTSAFREMFGTADTLDDLEGVTHIVRIQNWYKDLSYQHMHFTTTDGISFRMTVDKQGHPQAAIVGLDLSSRKEGQTVDLPFCSVVVGSDYVDTITGNKLNNHIEGGKGNDVIKGMDGKDMYVIREGDGVDNLDNFATDSETDILLLLTSHSSLSASASGDDLVIKSQSTNTGVIIKKWFSGDTQYLHLQLVDKDGVVVQMPTDRNNLKLKSCYIRCKDYQNADLRKKELQHVTDVRLHKGGVRGNSQANIIYANETTRQIDCRYGYNTYVLIGEKAQSVYMSLERQLIMLKVEGEIHSNYRSTSFEIHQKSPLKVLLNLEARHAMEDELFKVVTIWSNGILCRLARSGSDDSVIVPIMVDYSVDGMHWKFYGRGFDIDMNQPGKFKARRLIAPWHKVRIQCNGLGNYIDPRGNGTCIFTGNGPTDAYVFKSNYGPDNVIHLNEGEPYICAKTILFLVPYDDIRFSNDDDSDSLYYKRIISSDTVDLRVTFKIPKESRPSQRYFNFLVLSSDGVTTVVKNSDPDGNYWVPRQINRANYDGQTLNLASNEKWATILSVYGSTTHSNHLTGNSLNNTLVGGDLDDTLIGMDGDDTLKGGAGDDHMYGGHGNDLFLAGKGNDYMYGEDDTDVFVVPISGNHHVDGGNGSDTVVCVTVHRGCTASLTEKIMYASNKQKTEPESQQEGYRVTLNDIENIEGTPYADSLVGDDGDNTLNGLAGDDVLNPMLGADSLTGGEGHDTYSLVAGASGFSAINNFAKDKLRDTISVVIQNKTMQTEMCDKKRWKDLFVREELGDNLIIRWLSITNPVYYDNFYMPRISLHNWFDPDGNEDEYQHLCLKFCDVTLCDEELTP